MKKVKFIVILCSMLMFGVQSVQAQLFRDHEIKWFSQDDGDEVTEGDRHGGATGGGEVVPIGSGVAILLGLGAGYACLKRSRNED